MDVWYDGSHAMSFYQYGTSDNPVGTLIGHSWKNWGLVPTSRPLVAPPDQKTSTIEINGADGVIDASESLTKWPLYKNRTGSWTFYVTDYNNYDEAILDNNDAEILDNVNDPIRASILGDWQTMYTRLMNALHGKMLVVVLDDDPNFFYKGRFNISQWISSNDGSLSGVTINYDVFPYKLKKTNTGVFMRTDNPTLEIVSGRQPVIPYIYTMGAQDPNNNNARISGKTIKLEFTNPELGIHLTNVEYSNYTGNYKKMEDLGTNHDADFIVTNFSGNNVCTLTITDISYCEYVYIRYRVGDL